MLLALLGNLRRRTWARAAFRCLPAGLRSRLSTAAYQRALREVWTLELPRMTPAARRNGAPPAGSGLTDLPGVNVIGFLSGSLGLGGSARAYVHALQSIGCPLALNDVVIDPHGKVSFGSLPVSLPHRINLLFVNPDVLPDLLSSAGVDFFAGRHTIACWFWELDTVPDAWQEALRTVDEIMAASAFIRDAFARASAKPVMLAPLPLPDRRDSGIGRHEFGVPDRAFLFLASFDFNSCVHRKNPAAVMEAFRRAFPRERDDVMLFIKTSQGHRHLDALGELVALASLDPRIRVRDGVIDESHLHALERCADAYVSLHRAEGFGLALAECMALGKPVVATAWSGNLQFMHEGNSCLVGYRLVPVPDGHYPHAAGLHWAEPDIEEAAAQMRRLVDEPAFAETIGRRAKADIAAALAPQRTAALIAARLKSLERDATRAVH
jgi:glycosyltransferase involved in cell wall biosynthesis